MQFEVVYAVPDRVLRRWVEVAPGATADEVLALSGLLGEIDESRPVLGVHGRKVDAGHVMQRGERLEILRPLLADPRQQRRRRAQQAE